MKICFYNMNHIGDIYFSSLFINIICKLNQNIKFLYYFINGNIFLKKILNIKRICPLENTYLNNLVNGTPPEDLLNNSILQLLINHNMQSVGAKIIEYNNTPILFVNTWCMSIYLKHDDYDIKSAIFSYEKLIYQLNNEYKLNLQFKIQNPIELIEDIIEDKQNNKDDFEFIETIFIFNYKPRSLNFDLNQLNKFIFNMSINSKIILSCYNSIFDNNINIKFIDRDYNIYPIPSCDNLLNIWEIASKCKNIILLPTGSTWTFLHKLTILNENQLFMFNDNVYCNKINNNINLLLGENKNLIKQCTF